MIQFRRSSPIDRKRNIRLRLEELEARAVPSATVWQATPNLTVTPLSGPGGGFSGYTPAQISQLYGFNQVTYNGTGQTIAIVDANDDPNIASDLLTFDKTYNLPGQTSASVSALFTKVGQAGSTTSLPRPDSGWSLEISLDVEWAHAMAPGAKILLVEANSSSESDLLAAINTARNTAGVSVVSMSFGGSEFSTETGVDSTFTTPAGHAGVTFVAAAGDNGAGTEWPAVSPNVLAVGGTTLSSTGVETAWSGSGGGYSRYEARPAYQASVSSNSKRAQPDVAYDANPSTGVRVYDSYGSNGWNIVGGTSAGAPQWSALIADADQARVAKGLTPISSAESAIYNLSINDFHQITSGNNGLYAATSGFNLVTGRGSPKANLVINDLAGNASGGTNNGSTGSTGSGTGSGGGGSGSGTRSGTGTGSGSGPVGYGGGYGGYWGGWVWGIFFRAETYSPASSAVTSTANYLNSSTVSTNPTSVTSLSSQPADSHDLLSALNSAAAYSPILSALANLTGEFSIGTVAQAPDSDSYFTAVGDPGSGAGLLGYGAEIS